MIQACIGSEKPSARCIWFKFRRVLVFAWSWEEESGRGNHLPTNGGELDFRLIGGGDEIDDPFNFPIWVLHVFLLLFLGEAEEEGGRGLGDARYLVGFKPKAIY